MPFRSWPLQCVRLHRYIHWSAYRSGGLMFKAIYLTKENNQFSAQLANLDEAQLPAEGDVLAKVEYSTINYKDGLALTDKAPVVRKWPMVPGIDCAGVIESSGNPEFKPGEAFVTTGSGPGE